MKSAEITNGVVTNVIIGWVDGFIECSDSVQIGWLYNPDAGFHQQQQVVVDDDLNIEMARQMMALPRRELRLRLLDLGLLDDVEAMVSAGDRVMQIWYRDSTVFARNNEMVVMMGNALGLNDEQMDKLFTTMR